MDYKEIFNTVENVNFRKVIYAEGKWIIVGINYDDKTYHICTSEDLINFTDKVIYTEPEDGSIQIPQIAYGNGIYVIAVANNIFVSKDLENWNYYSIYNVIKVKASNYLKFINNKFILVTWTRWTRNNVFLRYEGHVLSSSDGITWVDNCQLDYALTNCTYYNGYYYLVGTNGYCARSTNLKNWVSLKTNISEEIVAITGGARGLMAIADNCITLFSEDGRNWKKVFTNNDRENVNVEYGNGIYMILQSPTAAVFSKDGINYEYIYKGTSGYVFGMAFSQEKQMFLICGNRWVTDNTGSLRIIKITRDLVSSISDEELLYIYDLNFEFLDTIDSFKSFRWKRRYFEAGEFEIVLSVEENLLSSLKLNNLILRNNYTEAGIIESIKLSDDGNDEELTIKGRFLSIILNRRIVKSLINFKGQVIEGMKSLLNQMTPFPTFEIEQTNMSSDYIEFQCSYKNVYDHEVKLSKFSGIGFRIVPNIENKVFIFENYKGLDRSIDQSENERYSFSDDEYNIDNADLVFSNTTKVNYALVGGTGEGTSRILVEVKEDESTGFDLYEKFVDSKNQSNQNLSSTDYKSILTQDGKNSFASETEEFTFSINDSISDYKDKFDLGDIVDIFKSNWNYRVKQRIVEVEEVIEDGKKSVSITTGTPLPEMFIED